MFRVRWEDRPLTELARLRSKEGPAGRQAIAAAVNRIDQLLTAGALDAGESRAGRQRILFVSPLVVTFQVEADGKTASVLTAHLMVARGS